MSLSARGGALSQRTVRVPAGAVRSEEIVTVTPDGEGPVTVSVDEGPSVAPYNPGLCYDSRLIGVTSGYCYRGVRVAPGPPLVLFGIADRTMRSGGDAERIELAAVFANVPGAADLVAVSSDPAVAEVALEDRVLTVTPGSSGVATVMVTATGADGEHHRRRFAVTVSQPSVPLLLSGAHGEREGFVRLINRSAESGEVVIRAIDDAGMRHGPVRLSLGAHAAGHFNSGDLARGNAAKGLSGGVGSGAGDWRLEFESAVAVEALAHARTRDGFLTSLVDVAPVEAGVHRVAIFNPADNTGQVSRLRVSNAGLDAVRVTVRGVDDAGMASAGSVRWTLPAGESRTYTASQLESGHAGFEGALGDGEGKWRLTVEAGAPVVVMSLLENVATGHLTNLSAGPVARTRGAYRLPLFPSASDPNGRQGFARVMNRSDRPGTVRVVAHDDAGAWHGPLELSLDAGQAAHFNSEDLELGNAAKGLSGSTGAGEGDWHLQLTSDLDIDVLGYVRMPDGFLTTMHEVAAWADGAWRVAVFNPGSNTNQVSWLRVVNTSTEEARVEIRGEDDAGVPGEGQARGIWVPARGALTLTAAELEAGVPYPYQEGYWDRYPLGDGTGKWRLVVTSEAPLQVMSLLESPTGHLTNLSTAPDQSASE